ncbi:TPA: fimbria/pilus periplasmic chaperone [Escherichia coli]|nr:fimbria/pilus periplasmic chaperone [Escherichia coli]HBB8532580.1 fimbria/pilus periplasmic chaperone [Escherichia coli]HCS6115845.1 fimbria/pilus periplasmic chaperone [Escherichia coli]
MRVLLINTLKKITFFLLTSCCMVVFAAEPELGVAIEPMRLTIKQGTVIYFTVINDTEREYIVIPRVISDSEIDDKDNIFVFSPPLKILKKREKSVMGIVYLKRIEQDKMKCYLSVSFIPKVTKDKMRISIPVVLVHQIPLTFE